jgi:hypothetical protein
MTDDTWEHLDKQYYPKRKVNNKLSWKMPHSKGSFYSNKMNRTVEYESLSECLFYYLLELDPFTERYYVQPVEIDIPYYDKEGDLCSWAHIPDVLVFRSGNQPCLYQIKSSKEVTSTTERINKICLSFSKRQNWHYKVVHPKNLPESVRYNMNFLVSFTRSLPIYLDFIDEIIFKLKFYKSITIWEMATSFQGKTDPLFILPIIYHLITLGEANINLNEKISTETLLHIGEGSLEFENFFSMEGFSDEG